MVIVVRNQGSGNPHGPSWTPKWTTTRQFREKSVFYVFLCPGLWPFYLLTIRLTLEPFDHLSDLLTYLPFDRPFVYYPIDILTYWPFVLLTFWLTLEPFDLLVTLGHIDLFIDLGTFWPLEWPFDLLTFDLLTFGTGAFWPFEVLTFLTKGTTSEQHYLDLHKSMHKISKTELKKVNNATWIYVKVCIKSQKLNWWK